jgi:5'-nucleotidase
VTGRGRATSGYTSPVAPPVLLLPNDDGYHSEGIQVLADALDSIGEVWVVAPDRENSAVSHALTLARPLRLRRLADRRFVVDGTPTDCVTLGIYTVLRDHPPALVVSGINFGANMGVDVHYSGTVSAAFEAAILGVPAIAVSQVVGEGFSFVHAAQLARELATRVMREGLPPGALLNANVPPRPPRGIRFTRLGERRYTEGVVEDTDPRGRSCYWIGGGEPVWENIPGTDFAAVGDGYVSITPLHLDMTEHALLSRLVGDPDWDLEVL